MGGTFTEDGIKGPETELPVSSVSARQQRAAAGLQPRMSAPGLLDQFEDQALPPEAPSLAEEENRFMVLKHEAALALLATILSSSAECRRFLLGRVPLDNVDDALDLGQQRFGLQSSTSNLAEAHASQQTPTPKNPRFVRKPKTGAPAAVEFPLKVTVLIGANASPDQEHPGLKLLEYLIELIPICRRIATLSQRLLSCIRLLAQDATESELQLFFKPLAVSPISSGPAGQPHRGKAPILDCISSPSCTLEVCHLAIDVCFELARSRSVYDQLMSSSGLWDRVSHFFGPRAKDNAQRTKKKEVEQHQSLVVSSPSVFDMLTRCYDQLDTQLRLTRMACIRLFSLLLTIYPDSREVFMSLVKNRAAPSAAAAPAGREQEKIQIDEKKVVSLLGSFVLILSEETTRILSASQSAQNTSLSAASSSSSVSSVMSLSSDEIGSTLEMLGSQKNTSVALVREMIQWLRLFSDAVGDIIFAAVLKTFKHVAWSIALQIEHLLKMPAFRADQVLAEHYSFLTRVLKRTEELRT